MYSLIESCISCAGHRRAIRSIRDPRAFNSAFGKRLRNRKSVPVKALFSAALLIRSIVPSGRKLSIFEPKHVDYLAALYRRFRGLEQHPRRVFDLAGSVARRVGNHLAEHADVVIPTGQTELVKQPSRRAKFVAGFGQRVLARIPLL